MITISCIFLPHIRALAVIIFKSVGYNGASNVPVSGGATGVGPTNSAPSGSSSNSSSSTTINNNSTTNNSNVSSISNTNTNNSGGAASPQTGNGVPASWRQQPTTALPAALDSQATPSSISHDSQQR
ncbi:hypothetical protein [Symbiopectobacterium sp. RP]|uniref:hypothetical protein n=1 Tax=Symbiopectobacterium sp. RP TaxID=3248553 RepID=UPI003D27DF36